MVSRSWFVDYESQLYLELVYSDKMLKIALSIDITLSHKLLFDPTRIHFSPISLTTLFHNSLNSTNKLCTPKCVHLFTTINNISTISPNMEPIVITILLFQKVKRKCVCFKTDMTKLFIMGCRY